MPVVKKSARLNEEAPCTVHDICTEKNFGWTPLCIGVQVTRGRCGTICTTASHGRAHSCAS